MITEPQPQRCPSCGQQDCRADLCESPMDHNIVVIKNAENDAIKREWRRYEDTLTEDFVGLNVAVVKYGENPVHKMRAIMLDAFRHGLSRGWIHGQ